MTQVIHLIECCKLSEVTAIILISVSRPCNTLRTVRTVGGEEGRGVRGGEKKKKFIILIT